MVTHSPICIAPGADVYVGREARSLWEKKHAAYTMDATWVAEHFKCCVEGPPQGDEV